MVPYVRERFFKGGTFRDLADLRSQAPRWRSGVTAVARVSTSEHHIVSEVEYTRFRIQATDPDRANYWDVVLDLLRTEEVRMEAPDNVFCLYEMESSVIGCLHVGRLDHPTMPGRPGVEFQVFGSAGSTSRRSSRPEETCCRV